MDSEKRLAAGSAGLGNKMTMNCQSCERPLAYPGKEGAMSSRETYDCGMNTNCGNDDCVAHGGHGGDS